MKKIHILRAVFVVLLSVVFGSGAANLFAQTTLSGAKKGCQDFGRVFFACG